MASFELSGDKCQGDCSGKLSVLFGLSPWVSQPAHGMYWIKKVPCFSGLDWGPCLRPMLLSSCCLKTLTFGPDLQDRESTNYIPSYASFLTPESRRQWLMRLGGWLTPAGVLSCVLRVDYGDHQDENTREGEDYHDSQDNQPQEKDHVHLRWSSWAQRTAGEKCCSGCVGMMHRTKTEQSVVLSSKRALPAQVVIKLVRAGGENTQDNRKTLCLRQPWKAGRHSTPGRVPTAYNTPEAVGTTETWLPSAQVRPFPPTPPLHPLTLRDTERQQPNTCLPTRHAGT